MSVFLALTSQSFGALDTTFGEALTITPQTAGEFTAPGADPTQPPYVAVGILDVAAVVVDDTGTSTGARSEAQTTTPTAEFAYSQFGTGRPLPQVGWRIDSVPSPARLPPNAFIVITQLSDPDESRIRFQLQALTS